MVEINLLAAASAALALRYQQASSQPVPDTVSIAEKTVQSQAENTRIQVDDSALPLPEYP